MQALNALVLGRMTRLHFAAAALIFVFGLVPLTPAEAGQKRIPPVDYKPPTPSISFASEPSPLKTGENAFDVILKDPTGRPVTDADVLVVFRMPAMPSMNMPEMRNSIPLKHAVAGRYSGTGQVAMAGRWEVTVVVKRGEKEIGNKKFKVTAQ